ncbi:MAG: hypothetical protein ACRD96_07855, partial [Bryobacteraceae bacterium]
MSRHAVVAAAVAVLTALTFFQFPGHTWLQSDTQIYAPILEHFWDRDVLARDLIVERPHVAFTLYDEIALALRKVTGLGFREILKIQQAIARALGIWGTYLIARGFGMTTAPALLVAAILSLGATIGGPSVLSIEYEPVPRGFAVSLLLLAIGLAVHQHHRAAGVASAIAFLYHPPTTYPFWVCMAAGFVIGLHRRKSWAALAPFAFAAAALAIAAPLQTGPSESHRFFSRLEPDLEQLQRMRGAYNWISIWGARWLPHYAVLWAVAALATARLWTSMSIELRLFAVGLPAIGAA